MCFCLFSVPKLYFIISVNVHFNINLQASYAEMAKVLTSRTQVEVQILVLKNTLVKVEVLI